jgi:flavin-dependent dehydrogenase
VWYSQELGEFLLRDENVAWLWKQTSRPEGDAEMRRSTRPHVDGDVVVVGAGPAGAATAAHLARRGLSVILVDRQQFPRDKVCGDFVGPVALRELHRLGITDLPEYRQSNVIQSAAIHLDGKPLMSCPIPNVQGLPSYGRVVPRMVLDRWIVQAARAAGAHVLESNAHNASRWTAMV